MTIFRRFLILLFSPALLAGVASGTTDSEQPRYGPRSGVEIRKPDFDALPQERRTSASNELLVQFKRSAQRAVWSRAHQIAGTKVVRRLDDLNVDVVRLPPSANATKVTRRYLRNPLVTHVEPNVLRRIEVLPDDPRWDDQWGLHNLGQSHAIADPPPSELPGTPDADIDAPEAWDIQRGDPSSVVAVIDTGVDTTHPDLNDNIWTNPDEVPGNNLDDDGNGYVDDVRGWDFGEDDNGVFENSPDVDGFDHGTHVAGTIAAEMDNGTGVAGVCPECRVMVLKIGKSVDTDGDGEKDAMGLPLGAELEALTYARREGADVVNVSFVSDQWSSLERSAFRRLGEAGVLTAAAAGNDSLDNDMLLIFDGAGGFGSSPLYPASYDLPKIVSVAASNHKDHYGYHSGCATEVARWICEFSSWGNDSVDLAAPGVDIVSTIPGGGYDVWNGTSMAAPHVAGAAGLVKSQHPAYGAQALKNVLLRSVDRPDTLRTLYVFRSGPVHGKFTVTSGRLNVKAGLLGTDRRSFPISDGNISGARPIDKTKSGRVAWPGDVNDVYKRRFVKGNRYRVTLNGPNDEDFDLLGWRPNTKEIWQIENGCAFRGGRCKLLRSANKEGTADETFSFSARRTGIYYIHVEAFLRSGGNYDLRIRKL